MPHEPNAHDVLVDAHAFWLRAPGHGEIRPVALPEPGRDDVVVRTLRSGVSRGTETLVFRGGVPPGQYAAMRAPFQEGEFPGPVKDGYLNVGAVEEGPPELRGRTVFCLYPHQTVYVVPSGAVTVVPDDVPPARAVLAGTVETAVNAPSWNGARIAAYWPGGTPPRKTSVSVPRLTPDRSVRTTTSSRPGWGSATGRISPCPGARSQNACASSCTGFTPPDLGLNGSVEAKPVQPRTPGT